MQITSDRNYVVVDRLPHGITIEWPKGSHTIHVHNEQGRIVDMHTFAWEKNSPSMLDFTECLQIILENSGD